MKLKYETLMLMVDLETQLKLQLEAFFLLL